MYSALVPKPPQARQSNEHRLVRPDCPASLVREDIDPVIEQFLRPPSADPHAAEFRVVHRSVLESSGTTEYNQKMIELGFLERWEGLRRRCTTLRGPKTQVISILIRTLRKDRR